MNDMIMDWETVSPEDQPTQEELDAQQHEDARAAVGVHTADDVPDEEVDWTRTPEHNPLASPSQ